MRILQRACGKEAKGAGRSRRLGFHLLHDLVDESVELLRIDRLRQMVSETGRGASVHVGLHAVAAHRDADGTWLGAEPFHDLVTGAIGQAKVADDNVKRVAVAEVEGIRLAVGKGDPMAALFQEARHDLGGGDVIFNHQDPEVVGRFPRGRKNVIIVCGLLKSGQFQGEGGASTKTRAGRGKAAFVQGCQSIGNGEAQPKPAEHVVDGRIALFKGIENSGQRLGRDADPGIGDLETDLAGSRVVRAQSDLTVRGSKLDRVADEVPQDLLDAGRVGVDMMFLGQHFHLDLNAGGGGVPVDDIDRLPHQVMGIDGFFLQLHFAIGDAGQVQQIVDQVGFQFHVPSDHGNISANPFGKCGIDLERAGGHQNRVERGAQFVAEDGEEAVLGRVGPVGFGEGMAQLVTGAVERGRQQLGLGGGMPGQSGVRLGDGGRAFSAQSGRDQGKEQADVGGKIDLGLASQQDQDAPVIRGEPSRLDRAFFVRIEQLFLMVGFTLTPLEEGLPKLCPGKSLPESGRGQEEIQRGIAQENKEMLRPGVRGQFLRRTPTFRLVGQARDQGQEATLPLRAAFKPGRRKRRRCNCGSR